MFHNLLPTAIEYRDGNVENARIDNLYVPPTARYRPYRIYTPQNLNHSYILAAPIYDLATGERNNPQLVDCPMDKAA